MDPFTGAVTYPSQQSGNCDSFITHCNTLRCPYGLLKSYDGVCERCECEDPCKDYDCPIDSKCSVDVQDQGGATVFVPVCRKFKKPGQCPRLEAAANCEVECHDDADCRGDYKCCSAGCSNICTRPMDERVRPTQPHRHHPEASAPGLDDVSEEDLNPVFREGEAATLKCFATGFPPPSITWKRQGIEVSFIFNHKIGNLQAQKSNFILSPAQDKPRSIPPHIQGRPSDRSIAPH